MDPIQAHAQSANLNQELKPPGASVLSGSTQNQTFMNRQSLGFLLGVSLILGGCATNKATFGSAPKLLRITASMDGSGRFVFTPQTAVYEHRTWGPPKEVTLDDKQWTDLTRTPATWAAIGAQLDLRKATIVQRKGRDTIALEPTPTGFALYLSDAPNGPGDYEVVISIPRRR